MSVSRYYSKITFSLLIAFFVIHVVHVPYGYSNTQSIPAPGTMVGLSPAVQPPLLKGIKVHPDNPFRFDFILDRGSETSAEAKGVSPLAKEDYLKTESTKLIKYFLAALTTPEKDLWVNLSPYEKDRIVPESFGQTDMGRDLLAQDYLLKQITASLIYPEDEIGKKFWNRVYQEARKRFGNTNVSVNTFNKVWIVPEKAVVYENADAGTAYVIDSSLKVMLEEDYVSRYKHSVIASAAKQSSREQISSQMIREIVIPVLAKEVNEGKNFAPLRQVYHSLILAAWYKKKIKSLLSEVYKDRNKISGIAIPNPHEKNQIYDQYLVAFKKGVYNYVKEEKDPLTSSVHSRKYFSGGAIFDMGMLTTETNGQLLPELIDTAMRVEVELKSDDPSFPLPKIDIKSSNLGYFPAYSVKRAFQHTGIPNLKWEGERVFRTPLAFSDHLVLSGFALADHVASAIMGYAIDGYAMPGYYIDYVLYGLALFGAPQVWYHLKEHRDGRLIFNNTNRYNINHAGLEVDKDLMKLIKKFEKENQWKILWTDDPHVLAWPQKNKKQVIMGIGWIIKSDDPADRRRLAYLNHVLRKIRKAIDSAMTANVKRPLLISIELFRYKSREELNRLLGLGVSQFVALDVPYFSSRLERTIYGGFKSWKNVKSIWMPSEDLQSFEILEPVVSTVAAHARTTGQIRKRLVQAAQTSDAIFVVSGGGIAQKIFKWPVNSLSVLGEVRKLKSEEKISRDTKVLVAWNPNLAQDDADRVQSKIDAGADGIITQPPFIWGRFKTTIKSIRENNPDTPIFVGVPVLGSNVRTWMRLAFGLRWDRYKEARDLVELFETKKKELKPREFEQFSFQWTTNLILKIEQEVPEAGGIHFMPLVQKSVGEKILNWMSKRASIATAIETLSEQGITIHNEPALMRNMSYVEQFQKSLSALQTAFLDLKEEGAQLPPFDVQWNWVINKEHFQAPVAARFYGGGGKTFELAVDVRKFSAEPLDVQTNIFKSTISEALDSRHEKGIRLDPDFVGLDQTVAWGFNRAFWGRVEPFMKAIGRDYRESIGGSPDTKPLLVTDTAQRLLKALEKAVQPGKPDKPFAYVEVGVASVDHVYLLINELFKIAAEQNLTHLLAKENIQFVLTDFSPAILDKAKEDLMGRFGAKYNEINFDYPVVQAENPLGVLNAHRGTVLNYHATNVFDNLPTLQIARKNGMHYEVRTRLYLPEDAFAGIVKTYAEFAVDGEELKSDLQAISQAGVKNFLDKYQAKFGDEHINQFYLFWQALWNGFKFDEEYVPIADMKKFDWLKNGNSGEVLLALLEQERGDLKMLLSSASIQAILKVREFLHPAGSIEIVDMMTAGLNAYQVNGSGPQVFAKYDGSLAARLNGGLFKKFLAAVMIPLSKFEDMVPSRGLLLIPALANEDKNANPAMVTPTGGIDFQMDRLTVATQKEGEGIALNADAALLAQLEHAPGFVPVIINIQPMTHVRKFLGLS